MPTRLPNSGERKAAGETPTAKTVQGPGFSDERKREAVEHCLDHGRKLRRTMEALGCPKGRTALREQAGEPAPGRRRRRGMMGGNVGGAEERGAPASEGFDGPPDGIETLRDMLREAELQLRRTRPELDVRQAALETVEKDLGADPGRPTDAEEAARPSLCPPVHALAFAMPFSPFLIGTETLHGWSGDPCPRKRYSSVASSKTEARWA